MPITRIFWSGNNNKDIHVVAGQTSPNLTNAPYLVFLDDSNNNHWANDYLNSHMDVTLSFTPLFKGTLAGNIYTGFGVAVNTATGEVSVTAPLPNPR